MHAVYSGQHKLYFLHKNAVPMFSKLTMYNVLSNSDSVLTIKM